jgi:outer membrane lipoprotein-sorting protein
MKKVLILLGCIILLSGCGKSSEDKLIKAFSNNINSSKSYTLSGSLEIMNDEDTFNYQVDVGYKKKDLYKVKLTNTTNQHVQVILKNTDGVYVITPSLNKSFKFQSEWPNNSSQAYLLGSILDDLNNTKEHNYKEENDYLTIETDVNYPNNGDLSYQKLYFDKDYNLKKNEVFNTDNQVRIRFVVANLDYKANLNDDYFKVDNSIDENCCNTETSSNVLNDIVYPLYIPSDTYLTTKETVATDSGSRAVLTFAGAKDFVLIEEPTMANKEFSTIPIYGDPIMMNGTVAALSGNSLYWTMNDVDYYLAGSDLATSELLSVANSISNTIVTGK